MRLLADGIVDVQTTQRENLTIKVSLGEVDLISTSFVVTSYTKFTIYKINKIAVQYILHPV